MPGRPVSEVVQQAADALDKGNYPLAVEACQRVLGQFPEFARAHLLLATAQLEQGELSAAERAFQETLRREPQSAAAYSGLSKIAEQRGELESALAYLQAGWENAPRDDALRERLARLSERLYGPGGRLHLTRAALGTLHAEAGRWSRAAAECAAVLEEHPGRGDVRLRLAEALWRRGNDEQAAVALKRVLDAEPQAVRALLILADIERRRGNQEQSAGLIERAHRVDLDGVLAADLISVADESEARPWQQETPLLSEEPVSERVHIAPAPDFTTTVSRPRRTEPAEQPAAAAPTPAPAPAPQAGTFELGLMSQEEVEAARPSATAFEPFDEVFSSIDENGVAPFAYGSEAEEVTAESQAPQAAAPPSEPVAGVSQLFTLATDEDILAARPPEERPTGYTQMLNSLDELGLQPFATAEAPQPSAPPVKPAAPGWATAEPVAVPEPEAVVEPVAEPVAPAEPEAVIELESEPETTAMAAEPAAEAAAPAPELDLAADLTAGWEEIDQEIEQAIPSGMTAGYTEELRRIDDIGLEPFSVEAIPGAETPAWLQAFELPAAPEPAVEPTAAIEQPPAETTPPADAADFLFDWPGDEDLEQAVPGELPRGFTMEFKELEASGIEPFVFGAPPAPSPSSSNSGFIDEEDLRGITEELESEALQAAAATPQYAPTSIPTPVSTEVTELAEVSERDGDALRASIERLGLDEALFERARAAKSQLVGQGQIGGLKQLPGSEPPGPTLAELEEAVVANPDDGTARRQLASVLVAAGEGRRALEQYRWLYHHEQAGEEVIGGLEQLAAERDMAAAGAERLIGAIYRRAGQLASSAAHYQTALELQLRAKERS
ncbi:MAG TPA: tetratricopeptide repeat protein [Thermomicrobiaceae bacterium]|nr:tetratricopeptide repeat protein [Thermomicrobiaceae bacterium]